MRPARHECGGRAHDRDESVGAELDDRVVGQLLALPGRDGRRRRLHVADTAGRDDLLRHGFLLRGHRILPFASALTVQCVI